MAKAVPAPVRKLTGRGGRRPGAGRPRKPGAISHNARPELSPRFPLLVTLRAGAGVPSLARAALVKQAIAPAIAGGEKADFRVVAFGAHADRLELVVEADDAGALARGVQGLTIRIARAANAVLGRTGKLFGERYLARALRSPDDLHAALRGAPLASAAKPRTALLTPAARRAARDR